MSGKVNTADRSASSSSTGAGPFPFRLVSAQLKLRPGVHPLVAVPDVGEGLRDLGRRGDPPSLFREVRRSGVEGPGSAVGAVLGGGRVAPERPAGYLAAESRVVEAVLEIEGEGAAERVEPVGRVGAGADLHPVDRELRKQVELHGVAERLVDAHPVLVDRDALGQPEERRRGVKPRKRRVGWKRLVVVPSRVTEPRRSLRASAIEAAPARREVVAVAHRHGRGQALAGDSGAGEGGDPHHVDLLGDGREGQRHVEHQRAPRRQPYLFLPRVEPVEREGNRVGARRQRQRVPTGVVGGGADRRGQPPGRDGSDGHPGQDRALRVGDPPGELRRLGRDGRRPREAEEQDAGEESDGSRVAAMQWSGVEIGLKSIGSLHTSTFPAVAIRSGKRAPTGRAARNALSGGEDRGIAPTRAAHRRPVACAARDALGRREERGIAPTRTARRSRPVGRAARDALKLRCEDRGRARTVGVRRMPTGSIDSSTRESGARERRGMKLAGSRLDPCSVARRRV